MPLPEFFGLCGRNNPRPCKIAWANTDSSRIGTYPSQFLPSNRTIWHATSQGGYSFRPPIIGRGESLGLPILGTFTGTGIFSVQFDTFSPTTRLIFCFVRTANRLNVAHVLTQAEINSANSSGVAEIDLGEFVYDAISATDTKEDIEEKLTEEEIAQLGDLQSESDRIFRKLFELPNQSGVANNRLVGVKVNREGIEYRLDNGGPKAISALDDSGRGVFVGAGAANTYRDGSSRIVLVNLKEPENYAESERELRAGDVIYLSYVAVREHYIRESVQVKWEMVAQTLPPICFAYPTILKHAAFRFYQWNITPDNANDSPVRISGWRVVETDNIPVNSTAVFGEPGAGILGDTIIGGATGSLSVPYLPTDATLSELQGYIADKSSLPNYLVNVNVSTKYHTNIGKAGQQTNTYLNAEWYLRRSYNTYQEVVKSWDKVLFNISPAALLKRDVDKFGIEQTLAQQLEIDIAAGKQTFFPFMDNADPLYSNPTEGSKDYISSANTKFAPVQPLSRWTTSNAEIECGVGGGVVLGFNSGFNGFGDVLGAFGIHSNIITERFENDTRILIEKFATEGEFAPNILAVEGLASPRGSVSCITDLMGLNAFAVHTDEEGFIRIAVFKDQTILDSFRFLEYRPDLAAPPVSSNPDPSPGQFEKLLGYSGMLGDYPGHKPGLAVSVSSLLEESKFRYSTTSIEELRVYIPNVEASQVSPLTAQGSSKLVFAVNTGWHGRLTIRLDNTGGKQDLLVLFKSGGIVGSVDTINMNSGSQVLTIDFRWIKCDTIEIIGSSSLNINVSFAFVTSLENSIADDFLSHPSLVQRNSEDKNLLLEERLYDKNALFKTDVVSAGQTKDGKLFVFFNDQDGGISCAQSNDKGSSWVYHYGVVEAVRGIPAQNPFVIDSHQEGLGYLFYMLGGKIMCKPISYVMFLTEDSMLVERFEQDREVLNPSGTDSVRLGLYSILGNALRRDQLSYVAAGDLSDSAFLNLLGKQPSQGIFEPFKEYQIEITPGKYVNGRLRSNPVALGSTTAFGNQDVQDPFFSVSHSDRGELALWYLADARSEIGGGQQLQCHFSQDGGINWYDKWEFIENSVNRLRADESKNTQFVDWSASGDPVDDSVGTDVQQSQQPAYWGINVHWSRLKKHKVNSNTTSYTDSSIVLPISSPYAIFHQFLRQIFLFYIYEGCLLCKIFGEGTMSYGAEIKRKKDKGLTSEPYTGMAFVKKIIEQETRSFFIDGNLSNDAIREELHYYINPATSERQVQGNIIYPFIGSLDVFNEERAISAQRVCAYRYSQCNVRVFYKLDGSPDLRCATWNGSNWFVEELMKKSGLEYPEIEEIDATDVTGGFGGSGYGPV